MQPANSQELRVADLDTYAWLLKKESKPSLDVLAQRNGRGGPVLAPPFLSTLNFRRGAARDSQKQRHVQRMRSRRAKSSSAEIVSPRSASAIASRSSASSSGDKWTSTSGLRVITVTISPSARLRPSTMTFPPMTVPVATCIGECHSVGLLRGGRVANPPMRRDARWGSAGLRYAYSKPWFRRCRAAFTKRASRFFAPQQRMHLRYVKSRLHPLRHRERMRRDIAVVFEEAESVWKTCSSATPARRSAWTVP